MNRGLGPIGPGCAGTRGFLQGKTPAAHAEACHWPGASGGALSTNGRRAQKTLD